MIDPVAFSIGPLHVRWYALAYLFGLAISIGIIILLNNKRKLFKDNNQIFDFVFWVFLLGVFLGGRLGYILFYNLPFYLEHPSKIIAVWEGGMSFHGGLIGSLIVFLVLTKKYKLDRLKLGDMLVVPGALADMLPRVANFINRELYGRPVENPDWQWLGVDFGDGILRFPSQLFQSAAAVILFLIMLFIYSRKPQTGITLFSYFIFYGFLRIVIEFWRQPDEQIGFLFNYFSLGQLLSFGVILFGVSGIIWVKKRKGSNQN